MFTKIKGKWFGRSNKGSLKIKTSSSSIEPSFTISDKQRSNGSSSTLPAVGTKMVNNLDSDKENIGVNNNDKSLTLPSSIPINKSSSKTGSIDLSSHSSHSHSLSSSNNSSSYHTAIAMNDNDFNLKDMLDGQINLKVFVKHLNQESNFNVERQTPLYDLLVIVANRFGLNPADYLIIASADDNHHDTDVDVQRTEKTLTLKSNPVGLIGTDRITIVPKLRKNRNNNNNNNNGGLPFTKTIRFTINLPQNQLMVKRIEPTISFNQIKQMICSEKSIDSSKYLLIKPMKKSESLTVIDLNQSPNDYNLNEVTIISQQRYEQLARQFSINSRSSFSCIEIDDDVNSRIDFNDHSNRLNVQQKNDWSQSTPNISTMMNNRHIQSSDTCSISSSRSRCFKKKPAPPPPLSSHSLLSSNNRHHQSSLINKSAQNLTVIHDDDEQEFNEQQSEHQEIVKSTPTTPLDSYFESTKSSKLIRSNTVDEIVVIRNQPKPQQIENYHIVISDIQNEKIRLNRQNSGSDSSGYHERLSPITTTTTTPTDSNSPQPPPSSISPVSNNSLNEDNDDNDKQLVNNDSLIQSSSSSSLSHIKSTSTEPLPKPASRSSLKSNQSKKRRAPLPPPQPSKRSSLIIPLESSLLSSSPSSQMINNSIDLSSNNRIESPCLTETSETELPNSLCCSEESNNHHHQEFPSISLSESLSSSNNIDSIDENEIDHFKVNPLSIDGESDAKIQNEKINQVSQQKFSNTTVIMADIHHHQEEEESSMVTNPIEINDNDESNNMKNANDTNDNQKVNMDKKDAVVVVTAVNAGDLNHNDDEVNDIVLAETTNNKLDNVVVAVLNDNEQQQQQQIVIEKKRSRWLQLLNEFGPNDVDSDDNDDDDNNIMDENKCSHSIDDGQKQCNECRYYIDNFKLLRSKFQNENFHHHQQQQIIESSGEKEHSVQTNEDTKTTTTVKVPEVIDNDDNVRTVSNNNNNNNNGNTDDDNVEIVDDNQTNNSSHNEEMKNKTINDGNDGGKPLVVVLDWQQRSSSSSSSTSSNNVATNKSTSVIKIDADKNETNNIDRNRITENIDKQVEVALNELEDTLEQCSLFNNNNDYDDDDDGNHDEKLSSSSSSSLNGTKIKLNGQIKTTTTTSKTSSSMGNNRTTKVVINSMYDNNNNHNHNDGINRLSSNSFSVRDGIRKFNTINETNVSQQDLSSLRSTTVQLNPFVRRSTSKIYNDDNNGGEKMPKVNRKLDNFQIGSLSESPIDIYQMKKPSSMMTNVVRNNDNDNTKTSTVIQINNSNNDNNNKTTTATIHYNGNVNKLSSVVVVNNDNNHRDKYLMKQKSESMINNNNNNNNHEIQHRSNNNRPMLITTNNNVYNKNNTINVNNNNNNSKIRLSKQHSNGSIKQLSSPSSSSSPSPTDFLQELKLKSKTWSHRNNGLEFSNPAYDQVDTNQNSELRQRNFLQQKSVDNVSISIPPPPPPPPPSQPLVPLTQSVNRMITSQTLLAPKGWNQNRPTSKSNNQIHSPLRSVSMDLSKNTTSSSGDSRGALLNEIKNFHNNSRLKKVANNQPFSLKIN
ncbi:uncharacterized protein LOC113792280 isoform X3 [Dermatophagoides pteronyssinus]|uniref:uncharacterized protein LOC113792280 isoform X3 n=1 Tax=Dermatophagoides pteronyssinus TaxID=6956 RepID=UPI003F67B868